MDKDIELERSVNSIRRYLENIDCNIANLLYRIKDMQEQIEGVESELYVEVSRREEVMSSLEAIIKERCASNEECNGYKKFNNVMLQGEMPC